MPGLEIRTFETYDTFARKWHAQTLSESEWSLDEARDRGLLNEQETRHFWQLLGLLNDDETVFQLPAWLAEKKIDYTTSTTPTLFVGRITRETKKAVLVKDAIAARPLMGLAHRIHALKDGLSHTREDNDRRDWLARRLQEKQTAFENRADITELQDGWLPKSQIQHAIQRDTTDPS